MPTSKQMRAIFDMSTIKIIGPVDPENVPANTHAIPGQKRRWEELCENIIKHSLTGKWLRVDVQAGVNTETIRQGVSAELERQNMRSRVRTNTSENKGISLFFLAVPKEDSSNTSPIPGMQP